MGAFYPVSPSILTLRLRDACADQSPGPPLSFGAGATVVVGGFIGGAVLAPDMTRWNRSIRAARIQGAKSAPPFRDLA
jgi:purine-cytosine permease-like protein